MNTLMSHEFITDTNNEQPLVTTGTEGALALISEVESISTQLADLAAESGISQDTLDTIATSAIGVGIKGQDFKSYIQKSGEIGRFRPEIIALLIGLVIIAMMILSACATPAAALDATQAAQQTATATLQVEATSTNVAYHELNSDDGQRYLITITDGRVLFEGAPGATLSINMREDSCILEWQGEGGTTRQRACAYDPYQRIVYSIPNGAGQEPEPLIAFGDEEGGDYFFPVVGQPDFVVKGDIAPAVEITLSTQLPQITVGDEGGGAGTEPPTAEVTPTLPQETPSPAATELPTEEPTPEPIKAVPPEPITIPSVETQSFPRPVSRDMFDLYVTTANTPDMPPSVINVNGFPLFTIDGRELPFKITAGTIVRVNGAFAFLPERSNFFEEQRQFTESVEGGISWWAFSTFGPHNASGGDMEPNDSYGEISTRLTNIWNFANTASYDFTQPGQYQIRLLFPASLEKVETLSGANPDEVGTFHNAAEIYYEMTGVTQEQLDAFLAGTLKTSVWIEYDFGDGKGPQKLWVILPLASDVKGKISP